MTSAFFNATYVKRSRSVSQAQCTHALSAFRLRRRQNSFLHHWNRHWKGPMGSLEAGGTEREPWRHEKPSNKSASQCVLPSSLLCSAMHTGAENTASFLTHLCSGPQFATASTLETAIFRKVASPYPSGMTQLTGEILPGKRIIKLYYINYVQQLGQFEFLTHTLTSRGFLIANGLPSSNLPKCFYRFLRVNSYLPQTSLPNHYSGLANFLTCLRYEENL